MQKFWIGDWVYAGDWCYGQIVDSAVDDDGTVYYYVEFDTGSGGGCLPFELSELQLAPEPDTHDDDSIMDIDRLKEILRHAIAAYIFELEQGYDSDDELYAVLLNEFDITDNEFVEIMGCTFKQYR
jgi:hypothetical protein